MHRWSPRSLALALLVTLSLAACASTGTKSPPPDVKEVRPGILEGYLPADAQPDSLALVPPPPKKGSAAFARDEEAARATFVLRGSPRWELAIADADLHFPAAAGHFHDAIGFAVTKQDTPWLYRLLRRTIADPGLSTYAAKNHYARPRPFMANGEPIGTPDDEAFLRKDGSYPSGHTAIGWAWALILTEIVPDRTDTILARGLDYGRSRMILNVHWQSDVDAGRIMAAATVARLHANEEFRRDLEMAKREVARIHSKK